MSRSRRTRNRIVAAVALAFMLVALEFGAHLYLTFSAPGPEQSPRLYAEWRRIPVLLDDNGFWRYGDFHGDYYNIDNGLRRVTGQPTTYAHTLWLFGNSGMFDPTVADADTVASQLQRQFSAHGYHVRVVNKAMSAVSVSSELLRLRATALASGDTVLFVDGARDVNNDHLCDEPLAALTVLCHMLPHPVDYSDAPAYFHTLSLAREYAHSRGVSFYHFVQPCAGWQAMTPLGMPLLVPPADFASAGSCHTLPAGDAIAARAIYDALTLI